MKPRKIRRSRNVLATALVAGGCANVLGFEEPTEVACVSSTDCPADPSCVDSKCIFVGDCGTGGGAGDAGMGEAGSTAAQSGRGGQGGYERDSGRSRCERDGGSFAGRQRWWSR